MLTNHPLELPVYDRLPLEAASGMGCWLTDMDGRRYLDLYGGHAVAIAGHCHPRVTKALIEQASRLHFYSNAVGCDSRTRFLDLLGELAPPALGQAFLVNSGAEANEAALQLARRITGRRRVVTLEGGFHGRSLATLAVSGLPRYRELARISGGEALLENSVVAPWGDPGATAALVDERVAAVIIEPVQGLAGARDAGRRLLSMLRRACDEAGALLIFDEIQCGCGRVGAFTASQALDVQPDLLTLAKGIASGLPMGVLLMSRTVAGQVNSGDLGTTFGGGPLPCTAAAANLAVLRDEGLAGRALLQEAHLRAGLQGVEAVREVQGRGLLLGLRLDRPARDVQAALFERGVLTGTAADPAVLRLLPPLVLEMAEADRFLEILNEVLA